MKKGFMFFAVLLAANFFPLSAIAEEIQIVGTGSGAEILANLGKAFTKANPGVTVSVPKSIGSGGAIKAAGTDAAKVGRVARGIKEKEKSYGLTYVPVARLPIVI
ncbi:MAG: substrate-binding domain-containing protein, partial [Proteobacteria bacterium]|nr:substrate-binding domain-containing protein [Pseudomonadota bacterium]